MDFQRWKGCRPAQYTFRWSYRRSQSDLGGLEGLEGLEMHGFSELEGVSGVIRGNSDFGGAIEEKVSDLGGLEGLKGLEMHGF